MVALKDLGELAKSNPAATHIASWMTRDPCLGSGYRPYLVGENTHS